MPSLPKETRDYDYNTVNQLLSVTNPNLTFVYDDDGNMIQGHTPDGYVFTADYDAEDQMTSLEYTDGSSVVHRTEYRYSGDGFLAELRKYENGSLVDTVRIVRDGLLALQERDGSNNVVREYTWGLNLGGGIGGLLNLKQGGQDYAYLYDGKGNVAAVLDSSQSVVAAYRYAPFGELLAKTGSLTQPFGFSTKRYDEQTGLIYYQYRPYAPSIGRWVTRDPLGEEGGMNLYAFVENNPVNWVDPWGLTKGGPQHGSGPGTSADETIEAAKEALNSGKGRDAARKILKDKIDELSKQAKNASGKERNQVLKRAKQLRAALKTLLRNTPCRVFLPIVIINPATGRPIGMYPKSDPKKPFDRIHNPGGYI